MELSSLLNDFERCSQILAAALDYEFERSKGGIVFDGWDPFIEMHNKTRKIVSKAQSNRNLGKLRVMLEKIIHRYQGNTAFAQFIYERSGYKLETIPGMHESVTDIRDVSVHTSGSGHHCLTYVVINLRGGSGAIYSIRGLHPGLNAYWKGEHTIVIEIPRERDEMLRHHQVSSFDQVVNIEYLEK